MKLVTLLVTSMLVALTARAQFGIESRTAVGLYYSPMLPFTGFNEVSVYQDYKHFYYTPEYKPTFAYSQSIGAKLAVAPSETFHFIVGLGFTNRNTRMEQLEPENSYYYNSPDDTLFHLHYAGNFLEVQAEMKQAVPVSERLSLFYTLGAGFSIATRQMLKFDAKPFEGPVIRNYEKVQEINRRNNLLLDAGVGVDYALSESLYLTAQLQYVFYLAEQYYFPYSVHTGRINIGLNYWLN